MARWMRFIRKYFNGDGFKLTHQTAHRSSQINGRKPRGTKGKAQIPKMGDMLFVERPAQKLVDETNECCAPGAHCGGVGEQLRNGSEVQRVLVNVLLKVLLQPCDHFRCAWHDVLSQRLQADFVGRPERKQQLQFCKILHNAS